MTSLEKLLDKSVALTASEMILAPGQNTRARVAHQWHIADEAVHTPAGIRQALVTLLDEDNLQQLENQGLASGQVNFRGIPVRWQILSGLEGLSGHFQWTLPSQEVAWGFPTAVSEVIARSGGGLAVVAGTRRSGKTSAVKSILRDLSHKRLHVVFFSEGQEYLTTFRNPTEANTRPQELSFEFHPLSRLAQVLESHLCADVIIVDSLKMQDARLAVSLAENGYSVILTMNASQGQAALENLAEILSAQKTEGLRRLSQVFQMCLGVQVVSGLEHQMQPVFELMMGTAQLRAHLREGRWEMIESLVQTTGEKTGMRSLNQSLMQLLIKRKIELRVGFESSPKPEDLDHLLRKVGL